MNLLKKEALWFGAGFAIAAVLSVSFGAVRYVPIGIAFGLLCFLCGLLLFQFVSSKKHSEEITQARLEDRRSWWEARTKLTEEKSKWQDEKDKWDAQKKEWEARKKEWEEDKEAAFCEELARMIRDEPVALEVSRKEMLRIAEAEAARRGGEQIDQDMEDPNA